MGLLEEPFTVFLQIHAGTSSIFESGINRKNPLRVLANFRKIVTSECFIALLCKLGNDKNAGSVHSPERLMLNNASLLRPKSRL